MTIMQEIGLVLDCVLKLHTEADKAKIIIQHIMEKYECEACYGSGRNSPISDDACMGCNGTGVQN